MVKRRKDRAPNINPEPSTSRQSIIKSSKSNMLVNTLALPMKMEFSQAANDSPAVPPNMMLCFREGVTPTVIFGET